MTDSSSLVRIPQEVQLDEIYNLAAQNHVKVSFDGTDYISVMPTNLYGPNDNYHLEHSCVLLALIRRFHEAKVSGLKPNWKIYLFCSYKHFTHKR